MQDGSSHTDELVYMVTAVDEKGDTHIFVCTDRSRADNQHSSMLDRFTGVRADWIDEH